MRKLKEVVGDDRLRDRVAVDVRVALARTVAGRRSIGGGVVEVECRTGASVGRLRVADCFVACYIGTRHLSFLMLFEYINYYSQDSRYINSTISECAHTRTRDFVDRTVAGFSYTANL